MFEFYLSLGSNLGDRERNLVNGIKSLSDYSLDNSISDIDISSIYESDSIGDTKQPKFFNIALRIDTSFQPDELLTLIKMIEEKHGRNLSERNLPRVLDIDIIFARNNEKNLIIRPDNSIKNLEIPHPRAHLRAFVLLPLLELGLNMVHPTIGKNLNEILVNLKPQNIIKLNKIDY